MNAVVRSSRAGRATQLTRRGPRRPRRRSREGRSIVEVVAIVTLVGAGLAASVPTFLRELRTSKTGEATEHLDLLFRRSASYFAAFHTLEDGTRATHCLPERTSPTPAEPSQNPREHIFNEISESSRASWKALGFAPLRPVRFRYSFQPTSSGCDLQTSPGTFLLTLRAEGDLDDDGERSLFERRAAVNEEGVLVPFGILYVRDRME